MEEMNEDNLPIEEVYSEDDVDIPEACPVDTGALGTRPEDDTEHAIAEYLFLEWVWRQKLLRYLNDLDALAILGPTRWLLKADGIVKGWVANYCNDHSRTLPAPPAGEKKADYRKKFRSARMQAAVFAILRNLLEQPGEHNVTSAIFDAKQEILGLAPRKNASGKLVGQVFDASIPVGETPVRDMQPDDNVATRISRAPDFQMPAPVWNAFRLSIMSGEQDRADFLEEWGGLCMTRTVKFEKFLVMGSAANSTNRDKGRNGKGKFTGVLMDLLGDLAQPLGFDRLMTSHNASRDLRRTMGDIHGKNLISSAEPNESVGQKLDQSLIKNITGGDKTEAAKVYATTSTRDATWKLMLNLNTVPVFEHTTAMMDRVIYVEFRETYTRENGRQDVNLPAKLRAEYPGILAKLLLAGQRVYQRDKFSVPASIDASSKRLFAKTDYAALFVENAVKADAEGFIADRELSDAAKAYVGRVGERGADITVKDVGAVIQQMGAKHVRRGAKGSQSWGWAGVSFV